MISDKEVDQMKENVYLSNSARGALVDEEAMINGLKSGKIAGYATDVLEEEPGRQDHPYLAFEQVVITPHISAYTRECLEAMGEKCVRDVEQISQHLLPERSVQTKSNYKRMMKKMVNGLKVKTGPQFYLYEEGGISKVSDLLKSYGAKRVLVTTERYHGKRRYLN